VGLDRRGKERLSESVCLPLRGAGRETSIEISTEFLKSKEDSGEVSSRGNASVDPRQLLAEWANKNSEWVRLLTSEVLSRGRPVSVATVDQAYLLFRQENGLDRREIAAVAPLEVEAHRDTSAPPLRLTRLSEVRGINALLTGAVLEPHEGLTILYGENGTGKTGYSRVFKVLADSRTADEILGDIEADSPVPQSAKLEYRLGTEQQVLSWDGTHGVAPFTRMSIFDSPAVNTHIDDTLEYVYTPLSLALFNHVSAAIRDVGNKIDNEIRSLDNSELDLLSRFQEGTSIYPLVAALGSTTDLAALQEKRLAKRDCEEELGALSQTVASLRSDTLSAQTTAIKSEQRLLNQAVTAIDALETLKVNEYNDALDRREELTKDHKVFRQELFAAVDLPAEPEETWEEFIEAADEYRKHLAEVKLHDSERCLYCRQPLEDSARELITKYSSYLEDKISKDIRQTDGILAAFKQQVEAIQCTELTSCIDEYSGQETKPDYFEDVKAISLAHNGLVDAVAEGKPATRADRAKMRQRKARTKTKLDALRTQIESLDNQQTNRADQLQEKQMKLAELQDQVELDSCWQLIEAEVNKARECERLKDLKRSLSGLQRTVTQLSKSSSDQLVNQSFDKLFAQECEALRAPNLKLEFVGRSGKAHRMKVMNGRHRPSNVLSEGEQKVLALADFLAEARLAGISAPIIFDDPVSSLDHRRVHEVSERIVDLSEENQVIVFTHDILFATTLINLSDKTKRCSFFHITDDGGKGQVSRASGPRSDSLSAIRGRINTSIQEAKTQQGEARDATVRNGYSHIRSWCEVFTEEELLQSVSTRYRANIQMTSLERIDGDKLNQIAPKVAKIYEIACRYIEGHSQPQVTLGVSPTISGLEEHWQDLQDLRKLHNAPTGN